MRKKAKKQSSKQEFDAANDLDFDLKDSTDNSTAINNESTNNSNSIDPTRSYSKYYTPNPKKGSRGGTLGRGAVSDEDRKIQFSVTCTRKQKALFQQAAKNDQRKLPEFICIAVEEYIKTHNLL